MLAPCVLRCDVMYVLMWAVSGGGEECGQITLMCAHIARVYYLVLATSAQQADGGELESLNISYTCDSWRQV